MIEEDFTRDLKSNLGDMGSDFLEFTIDNVFRDEVIDRLPVIGTIKNLASAGFDISSMIFAKKIESFLVVMAKTSYEDRKKMVEKIDNDDKYKTKVGETLIAFIDRCRDAENAKQVALLFKNYVEGNLDYDDFLRCAEVVVKISYASLRDFVLLAQKDIPSNSMDELLYSGVYRHKISPQFVEVKDKEELKVENERKKLEESIRKMSFSSFLEPPELEILNPNLVNDLGNERRYQAFVSGGKMIIEKTAIGRMIELSLGEYYREKTRSPE